MSGHHRPRDNDDDDDGLFMIPPKQQTPPNNAADVEPLRINKRASQQHPPPPPTSEAPNPYFQHPAQRRPTMGSSNEQISEAEKKARHVSQLKPVQYNPNEGHPGLQRHPSGPGEVPDSVVNPYPQFHQQYWPLPTRMTSTSTTAARRGSPPPPETPATEVGETPPAVNPYMDPRGRVPTAVQGRNSPRFNQGPHRPPSSSRRNSQQHQPQQQQPPRRPWTPTEDPESYPHGPPTVWHGTGGQNAEENLQRTESPRPMSSAANAPVPLEQEFERMNMNASPPPSYASLSHVPSRVGGGGRSTPQATTAQGYPDEKRTLVIGAATNDIPAVNHAAHPAFQHDGVQSRQSPSVQAGPSSAPQQQPQQLQQQQQQQPQPQQHPQEQFTHGQHPMGPSGPGSDGSGTYMSSSNGAPGSPPPLPEGWMAHLDPNSGQYYYIHIASSHTQWEPPSIDQIQATMATPPPMSSPPPMTSPVPGPSSYMHQQPLASPGFPPGTPSFPPDNKFHPGTSMMMSQPPLTSTASWSTSTMPPGAGYSSYSSFSPPPPPAPIPVAGIHTYNIAPANGEYFGPYLRYSNMNIDQGIWYGSILLVTEYPQSPTVHLHLSRDLSPNPRQLKAQSIYTHKTWTFYRYDIDIQMLDMPDMWTYAISTPLGCTRFEFLVAGRAERNWRFIAHSCNDFSYSVKSEERARLGGHGFMWKDLMQKHMDCGGFHAQLGGGDQIYADRMWKEVQPLKEWLEIKGKENRKNAQWTTRHEDEVTHAYFHYYTSSWDLPHIREAFAQIPYLFQLDDHDIFDGFGSYPEYMQFSNVFKNIGRIGIQWYLLFQQHATVEMLHSRADESDLFTITGTGWHFIKYLGPAVAVIGLDTRSERNPHQVMAGPTYQGIFPKIASLPASIQHAIIILAVPIIYPRLDSAESVINTVATGKKAVTGTFNLLGKTVGSVAGVIGAKDVVQTGFQAVKKGVGKQGLMSGVVSVFGEVDLLDDLRDHWTHESKDLERTYLIRTLQGISHSRGIRFTFLSGDVHVCGAGLVHDPNKPHDHKTMYQIVTSGIVNVPPPPMVLRMLHSSNKPLYVPQNGMRSTHMPTDTKEDMMEVFQNEVDGRPREQKKLMGKRNYAIFTAFEGDHGMPMNGMNGHMAKSVSLAVDFIVQGEGPYGQTGKYGPIVVPRLEPGW